MATLLIPSLIVLDENMPAKTGREVSERLAQSPVTAQIPVILLTGLSIQSSVPPNVCKVIAKPFSAKAIVETSQQILANSVAV